VRDKEMKAENIGNQFKQCLLPTVNSSLQHLKIISACGGACHTVFLSGIGSLLTFTPRCKNTKLISTAFMCQEDVFVVICCVCHSSLM
jgi:hypothetical protein